MFKVLKNGVLSLTFERNFKAGLVVLTKGGNFTFKYGSVSPTLILFVMLSKTLFAPLVTTDVTEIWQPSAIFMLMFAGLTREMVLKCRFIDFGFGVTLGYVAVEKVAST